MVLFEVEMSSLSILNPSLPVCVLKRKVYREAHIEADKASAPYREFSILDLHRCRNQSASVTTKEVALLGKWRSRFLKLRGGQFCSDSDREYFKSMDGLPAYFLREIEPSLSSRAEDNERLYIGFGKTVYVFRKEPNNLIHFEKDIKISPLDTTRIITGLCLDRRGRLIIFIRNSDKALALSQTLIQKPKRPDVDHRQLINAPNQVMVDFRTVKVCPADDIQDLSKIYKFNNSKYKVQLREYAGLEHLPDNMVHYYDQGYEPICGLAAWLNIAEQLYPEKVLTNEELQDLFMSRFQPCVEYGQDGLESPPDKKEAKKISEMIGLDLNYANISNIPLVTQKPGASWHLHDDYYSKGLAKNAQRIKDTIDAGKLFYARLDSSTFYLGTASGRGHAVAIVGYKFNQTGEMKLLVIDSNYGYAWVDLEHLCSSISDNGSWAVSKKPVVTLAKTQTKV